LQIVDFKGELAAAVARAPRAPKQLICGYERSNHLRRRYDFAALVYKKSTLTINANEAVAK
jgi:hypothetical protein